MEVEAVEVAAEESEEESEVEVIEEIDLKVDGLANNCGVFFNRLWTAIIDRVNIAELATANHRAL